MELNLCIKENLMNTSYFAIAQPEKNCGCVSCIRRCCKPGFTYKAKYCHGNSSEVMNVSVYTNKTDLVKILENSYENYIVGVPKCVMFKLTFPNDFYIQDDTKEVWVPQYNKFYNNTRYCVDEFHGFTPYLCFASTSRSVEPIPEKNIVLYIGMLLLLFFNFHYLHRRKQ